MLALRCVWVGGEVWLWVPGLPQLIPLQHDSPALLQPSKTEGLCSTMFLLPSCSCFRDCQSWAEFHEP